MLWWRRVHGRGQLDQKEVYRPHYEWTSMKSAQMTCHCCYHRLKPEPVSLRPLLLLLPATTTSKPATLPLLTTGGFDHLEKGDNLTETEWSSRYTSKRVECELWSLVIRSQAEGSVYVRLHVDVSRCGVELALGLFVTRSRVARLDKMSPRWLLFACPWSW